MRKDALLERLRQRRKHGKEEEKRGVYGDRSLERRDAGEEEDPPENTPEALRSLPL